MATSKTKAQESDDRDDYTGKDIEIKRGLDHVRQAPSMYIGSIGDEGLHHMLWEVLNNSVDEAIGGFANNVWVIINDDGSVTVKDDGRGIPVDEHPEEKKPTLEVILTEMGAGGKFGGKAYAISGGLHGMGISIVNACSKWMKVTSYRQGFAWSMDFDHGVATGPMKKGPKTDKLGTDITFMYDDEVLEKDLRLSYEKILLRLREFSYLVGGLRLNLVAPKQKDQQFYSENGLRDYASHMIAGYGSVRPINKEPVHFRNEEVEVVMQWTDGPKEQWLAFTNCINNVDGGTQVSGMRAAMTRGMNNYATGAGKIKGTGDGLTGEDVREGLFSVVAVKVGSPQFEGQTKVRLNNPEVKQTVEKFVSEELEKWLLRNEKDAKKIMARCLEARDGRVAAQKAKAAVSKRKGLLGDNSLPGKLRDCSLEDPNITELFVVEGDSAGGTGVQGRDPMMQAILPLRGKVINAEKESAAKLWANNEVRDLISAIGGTIQGAGAKVFVELEKPRYRRIILAADADDDGKHIITLLLTFFYREIPQLIQHGYLYVAIPPLFSVKLKNKTKLFVFSQEEVDDLVKSGKVWVQNGSPAVQRFKGLGEMNSEELRVSVMEAETRVIKRVTIEDAAEAAEITNLLMGKNVAARREFIEKNALDAEVIE